MTQTQTQGAETPYDVVLERQLDEGTGGLVSALMLASAREREWTMRRIEEGQQATIRDLAQSFAAMYDAFERIPEMQRTVYVDRVLTRYAYTREHADSLLGEDER